MNDLCQWWARCTRPATTTRFHPVLGNVPICLPCDALVARLGNEPERETA